MAHRGVWIPGSWKMREAVAQGQFLKQAAPNADATHDGTIDKCDTAKEVPFGVAYQDLKVGDLLDAHHAGPPSEIIEVKAGAAIPANTEVMVDANGEAVAAAGAGYVVGFTRQDVADGDIFELQVRPRWKNA